MSANVCTTNMEQIILASRQVITVDACWYTSNTGGQNDALTWMMDIAEGPARHPDEYAARLLHFNFAGSTLLSPLCLHVADMNIFRSALHTSTLVSVIASMQHSGRRN
jgi:hypothetical protein